MIKQSTRNLFSILTIAIAVFVNSTLSNAGENPLLGLASYYGSPGETANGERMNPDAMTAAHKTLPFNTRVRVMDVLTHRSVIVRINDRGPFITGTIIDLSSAAGRALGIEDRGVALVVIEILSKPKKSSALLSSH